MMKLLAPVMPFVTEEVYQEYFKKKEKDKSIHISDWPEYKKDAQPSGHFSEFCSILSGIRQAKSNNKKSMNAKCIITLDKKIRKTLEGMEDDFRNVTGAQEIKEGKFKVEFIN